MFFTREYQLLSSFIWPYYRIYLSQKDLSDTFINSDHNHLLDLYTENKVNLINNTNEMGFTWQTAQWNTWGPISESMDAAFPGWGPSTVAMMANWGTIMFVLFVFPMCWATQRCGLRAGVLSASALMFLGLSLRCITRTLPTFTM